LISNTEDYVSYVPSRIKLGKEIWKSNFRVNHRLAHVLQEGRTFLAGDAGHIHSPIGGRGMNIGIEDAFVFSKLLSTDRTEMYTDLRKPILEEMIKKINKATDVFLGKQNSMIKQSLPYLLPLFRFFAKKEITKFTLGLDHDIKV
jgi:2-polyprenyl-6-methoxyphenol hydroxylase-like FAD-dependent oxidoreductase